MPVDGKDSVCAVPLLWSAATKERSSSFESVVVRCCCVIVFCFCARTKKKPRMTAPAMRIKTQWNSASKARRCFKSPMV